MPARTTPLLPRNAFQGIRKLHSEISDEDQAAGPLFALLVWSSFVAWVTYRICRREGVEDLIVQLPEAKILIEREALRKEEEELKRNPRKFTRSHHCGKCKCTFNVRHDMSRKKRRELDEKKEALGMKELERLKQRAIVLEKDLETQTKSVEADRAEETPLEDVTAIHFRTQPSSYYYPGEEEETTFECPLCSGEVADPRTRKVSIPPSVNVVQQVANQGLEANKVPKSLPRQDESTPNTKPDTNIFKPPKTKTGQAPASTVVLEALAAERDAINLEMSQIKQAKEALTSREKELEAKSKDRKNRIQELNAPKSGPIWPVVQGMLFGSALAFGVMTSIFRN